VVGTTQNKHGLGRTVTELELETHPHFLREVDKTAFSMCVPELLDAISSSPSISSSAPGTLTAIIVGIETHICVTQTTLDLLRAGHSVFVVSDAVSSCNKEEKPIALARLAREGAVITTSESLIFEVMGDAKLAEFKPVSKVVKDFKGQTKEALEALCKI